MTAPGFSQSDFQIGDEPDFDIQADMRFVAIAEGMQSKKYSVCSISLPASVDLAFVLDPPVGVPVIGTFPFILLSFIFDGINIGDTVDTIHNLDEPLLNLALQGNLHNSIQHLLQYFLLSSPDQPFPKHGQAGMIRCLLINAQPHKVLGW